RSGNTSTPVTNVSDGSGFAVHSSGSIAATRIVYVARARHACFGMISAHAREQPAGGPSLIVTSTGSPPSSSTVIEPGTNAPSITGAKLRGTSVAPGRGIDSKRSMALKSHVHARVCAGIDAATTIAVKTLHAKNRNRKRQPVTPPATETKD